MGVMTFEGMKLVSWDPKWFPLEWAVVEEQDVPFITLLLLLLPCVAFPSAHISAIMPFMKPLLEARELGLHKRSASKTESSMKPLFYAVPSCGYFLISDTKDLVSKGIIFLSLKMPHVDAQTHCARGDHNVAELTRQTHHDIDDPDGISPMTKISPS